MLPASIGVGGDVDAIDFVVGYVAFDPLNLRSHIAQYTARLLRNRLKICRAQFARVWNCSFNDELRHDVVSASAREMRGEDSLPLPHYSGSRFASLND